jgi:glutamine amidotransferase
VSGIVNHFIVSSEPLQGENVWLPLEPGEIVGVDRSMRVSKSHVEEVQLPLA